MTIQKPSAIAHVLSQTKAGFFVGVFLWLCMAVHMAFGSDSYQIADGVNQVINEHGTCYTVANNTGEVLFVPTKTASEWTSFISSTLVSSSGIALTSCGVLCSTPSTKKNDDCSGTVLGSTTVLSDDITACHAYCQTVGGASCCEVSGTSCVATDGTYAGSYVSSAASVLCSDAMDACDQDGLTLADVDYTGFYLTSRTCGQACSAIIQQRTCSSGVLSGSSSYSLASCPTESSCADCPLDGVTVAHGNSYTFYSSSTPSCGTTCSSISQSRTCANGSLSGSSTYNKSSCTEGVGCPTCYTPWLTYGQYNCFGTVVGNTSGVSQTACLNFCRGLSGVGCCMWTTASGLCYARQGSPSASVSSWYITTCSTTTPVNCTLDGVTVLHNTSQNFYGSKNPSCPDSCGDIDLSRQCINGYLTGDSYYRWATCTSPIGCGASCPTVDGITLMDGESYTFYTTAGPSCGSGTTCADESQERTCTNGTLSGSSSYNQASCTDPSCGGGSCAAVDGITLNDGESYTFYSNAAPSCGTTCAAVSQLRTCTSGVLDGSASYNKASCTEPSCGGGSCAAVDGVTLMDGESHTFYTTSAPLCGGTTCAAASQLRTCTSGVLDGSASYNKASCTDPTGCCAPQSVSWFQSSLCGASSVTTIGNGDVVNIVDNTGPAVGDADFTCNNGTLNLTLVNCCSTSCSLE